MVRDMPLKQQVGRNIARIRREKGLTQEQLAGRLRMESVRRVAAFESERAPVNLTLVAPVLVDPVTLRDSVISVPQLEGLDSDARLMGLTIQGRTWDIDRTGAHERR